MKITYFYSRTLSKLTSISVVLLVLGTQLTANAQTVDEAIAFIIEAGTKSCDNVISAREGKYGPLGGNETTVAFRMWAERPKDRYTITLDIADLDRAFVSPNSSNYNAVDHAYLICRKLGCVKHSDGTTDSRLALDCGSTNERIVKAVTFVVKERGKKSNF